MLSLNHPRFSDKTTKKGQGAGNAIERRKRICFFFIKMLAVK
jgi:hypothetical protein